MEQFVEVSYFVWRKRGQAGKKWIYWKILHFPTETLHLLQILCTSERCSVPLTTILHLQQTLRPIYTTDTLHLKMTPGTSERRPVTPTNTVHQRLTSESLTGILHLLHTHCTSVSHQNLWQEFCISYINSAPLSHIRISDRNSASLTYSTQCTFISHQNL